MAVPARRAPRWPAVSGSLLPVVLVVALLVPMVLLFAAARGATGDERDLARRERLGVEYLRALGPVTEALVDAQSAAVNGRPVSRDALSRAVESAAEVDNRLGDQLRSHERWAGLRAKLEALPERSLADPEQAYTAYGEVTDLLLALHRKVGESSGLVHDPDTDSYFLQDSVADELPGATVAVGRLADLTVLAGNRPGRERNRSLVELSAARVAALAPAADLVSNLRAAVDNSESASLGANVISAFDAYQRAVETLAAASLLTGPTASGQRLPIDPTQLAAARLNAQAAARQLSPVIFTELDGLIQQRIEALESDRRQAVASLAAALLLLLLLAATLVAGRRRRHERPVTDRPGTASAPSPAGPTPPAGPAGPVTATGPAGPTGQPYAADPAKRDAERTPWRTYDAAR